MFGYEPYLQCLQNLKGLIWWSGSYLSVSEVQGKNSNPFPTALWIQYSSLD